MSSTDDKEGYMQISPELGPCLTFAAAFPSTSVRALLWASLAELRA